LQRLPQPDDDSNDDKSDKEAKEFKDWMDNLYGFVHMINNPIHVPKSERLVHILALEQTLSHPYIAPNPRINEPNYNIIPRGAAPIQADEKLAMIHDWLTFLERPNGLSDQDYTALVHQASRFFLDEHILWKRDPQGCHRSAWTPLSADNKRKARRLKEACTEACM
jgi:hypothetical protein